MKDKKVLESKEAVFLPAAKTRLSEIISEQIKEAILNGRYKPGEKLPSEKDLCESFQVGRAVIREGLRMLESGGLISIKRGSAGGVFAKNIEPTALTTTFEWIFRLNKVSLEELTAARAAVEMAVFNIARTQFSDANLIELQETIDRARKALKEGSLEMRNADFHLILAKLSGNKLLMVIMTGLLDLQQKFVRASGYSYERKKIFIDEHQHILDLLLEEKLDEAGMLLERHIKDSSCLFGVVDFGKFP